MEIVQKFNIEEELLKMGVGRYSKTLLCFLIKTKEEFDFFVSTYWASKERQFFSAVEYRMYRIGEKDMTLQEFSDLYKEDKKNALEELFQHPVGSSDVEYFLKKTENSSSCVEEIYCKHKEYPAYRLQRHLVIM